MQLKRTYMLTCSDLKFPITVNEGYHIQYTNLNKYTYVGGLLLLYTHTNNVHTYV